MVTKIKFSVFAVLTLCFFVFCGETAYSRYIDRACGRLGNIFFSKIYDGKELSQDILALSDKYDVCGFFTVYEYGECEKETYCCTSGDMPYISSLLGIKPCTFDTMTDSSYDLDIKEISDVEEDCADKMITVFQYVPEKGDIYSFKQELSEKYYIEDLGQMEYENTALPIGVGCLALILLLTLYDIMSVKRVTCIKLTLGHSLTSQIIRYQLRDTLFYLLTGITAAAILRRHTGIVLAERDICAYLAASCILNAMMYLFLYVTDVCAALKNSKDSAVFLPINYALKLVSAVLLISLAGISVNFSGDSSRIKSAEAFRDRFDGYNVIELSESPYWAQQIDEAYSSSYIQKDDPVSQLIDRELEDYNSFIKDMDESSGMFLLHAFDNFYMMQDKEHSRSMNAVLASDDAAGYIEAQTGTILSKDRITVLIPDSYYRADLNKINKWMKYTLCAEDISSFTETINYKQADVAVFGHEDPSLRFGANYSFDIMSSPIIVYVPHSADYDYFDAQEIVTPSDKEYAYRTLDRLDIRSTALDICPAHQRAEGYIKEKKSMLMIYAMLISAAAVYCTAVFLSSVMLDMKIRQKHRAIKKILGHGFISRHIVSYIITVPMITAAAAVPAAYILSHFGIRTNNVMHLTMSVMIVTESAAYFILAKCDEKKHTLKALKGGAL